MGKFFKYISPFFCAIILIWLRSLWVQIFRNPGDLGGVWILILGFVLVGIFTGIMVYRRSSDSQTSRVFFSITSGLGVTFLLPLIGVGGCCVIYVL